MYYATDCLESEPWTNAPDAGVNAKKYTNGNILDTKIPADPKCQYVQIDQFRMIWLSLDSYLSKRAWSNEGAFSSFHAVMTGWMADTKRVYEARLINTFVGTTVSAATKGTITIDTATARGNTSSEEEANRLEAQTIAKDIADLLVDLKDTTRDYNDYGFLRSYSGDDLMFVWNASAVNKIKKIDLPTIFNKEGLMEKMDENILPKRYFGNTITASDKGSGKIIDTDDQYDASKGTLRSLVEKDYTTGGTTRHVFPGDAIVDDTTVGSGKSFEYNEVYQEDDKVICKVIHKSAVPFMSAFQTETSFFNPRNLVENKYYIFRILKTLLFI